MMWDGMNQRRFPRVSYKCLIRVSKDGHEELIDTFTENIGAGGICVVLDEGFNIFAPVTLEIFLSDGEAPIRCNGAIVWVVKKHPASPSGAVSYDTGIEFKDISGQDRERVARLVDDILKSRT
jgi:hypothetical protein